jgi:epoxyqueuosine reductase
MARVSPHRPFTPDPAQMALRPDLSCNAVNGLGETEPRKPRMVYWAPNPADIPHGAMQRYFYAVPCDSQEERERQSRIRADRQVILDAPLPPVADTVTTPDEVAFRAALDGFRADGLFEQWGGTALRPEWAFEGHELRWRNVIVIGVAHDYDLIAQAPASRAGNEVLYQYLRAVRAAKDLAGWLRRMGHDAEPVTGPMTGSLALIPPAIACGFGELGKHGSIINREMGSSFRLSAVMTDAPIPMTAPDALGVDDFCTSCRICEDACPPEALFADKQLVRGEVKWYVDFDRCLPFFNQHQGCAICIAVCPWSRPGIGPNLAAKLASRRDRIAREG